MRYVLILIGVLLVSAPAPAEIARNPNGVVCADAPDHLRSAVAVCVRSMQNRELMLLLRESDRLRRSPGLALIHHMREIRLRGAGDHAGAERSFALARAMDPRIIDIMVSFGLAR